MRRQFDVAIVIPIHGDGRYLMESVRSCFKNSGPSFQLILVLDRATREVMDLLNPVQEESPNVRILVSKEPGISAALNLGIAESESDLVARLDSDDFMSPERIEIQVSFMKRNPQIDVCGSQVIHVDEESQPIKESHYPQHPMDISSRLRYANAIAHSSVIFRRQSFILAGGYRNDFDGAEDYDLWLRMDNKENLFNLPYFLTSFREHALQSAQNTPELSIILASKIRLEKFGLIGNLRLGIDSYDNFDSYLSAIKFARVNSDKYVMKGLSTEVVRLKYSFFLRTGAQKTLLRALLDFFKVSLVCLRYDWRETIAISRDIVANYSRTHPSGLSRTLIFGSKFDRCP